MTGSGIATTKVGRLGSGPVDRLKIRAAVSNTGRILFAAGGLKFALSPGEMAEVAVTDLSAVRLKAKFGRQRCDFIAA